MRRWTWLFGNPLDERIRGFQAHHVNLSKTAEAIAALPFVRVNRERMQKLRCDPALVTLPWYPAGMLAEPNEFGFDDQARYALETQSGAAKG